MTRPGSIDSSTGAAALDSGLLSFEHSSGTDWIACTGAALQGIELSSDHSHDRLLVPFDIDDRLRESLSAQFETVLTSSPGVTLLDVDTMRDVMSARNREDLLIGVSVSPERRGLVVYRGSMARVLVPFGWFEPSPNGVAPDFGEVEVIDHGATLRLGEYEAATSAILYSFDDGYRRREKARRVALDDSLGGAIRRLRLERGLRQSDFPDISAKEVGRIERGEVSEPHASTLARIAERLGVSPQDLRTF